MKVTTIFLQRTVSLANYNRSGENSNDIFVIVPVIPSIPERNTSGLGLAPSEPLVPPDEQWPPASQQPSLCRVGAYSRGGHQAIFFWGAVRCFSVLLNRQNSVRRGQNPREKTKIDQALRSGSFKFDFCQKRPGSSRSAKNSIRASQATGGQPLRVGCILARKSTG